MQNECHLILGYVRVPYADARQTWFHSQKGKDAKPSCHPAQAMALKDLTIASQSHALHFERLEIGDSGIEVYVQGLDLRQEIHGSWGVDSNGTRVSLVDIGTCWYILVHISFVCVFLFSVGQRWPKFLNFAGLSHGLLLFQFGDKSSLIKVSPLTSTVGPSRPACGIDRRNM